MASLATVRKRVFRTIKTTVGDQRARRLSIATRRFLYRARLAPSVKLKQAIHVPGTGAYVAGNIIDVKGKVHSVELILNNGDRLDITDALIRHPSNTLFGTAARGPNQTPAGFAAYSPYPESNDEELSAIGIRLTLAHGKFIEKRMNFVDSSVKPIQHVQSILSKVPAQADDKSRQFDQLYGPALQAIWNSRDTARPDCVETHYNAALAAKSPEVSVIVPIYGRYDFIEYQLSLFVRDPDMKRHELIYVIDDPRLHEEIDVSCDALSRIYPIAFRVLKLARNMGYAGANNVGVDQARGNNILLLNSDVMPEKQGWLRDLLNTVGESLPTSLTGARLLYEDRTVQHDGMKFFASPFMNHLWTNIHPGKGMPVDVFSNAEALVVREAVTGACLLLTRENYNRLGGLDEGYILGDFEDSDLCLKALEQGLSIQLAPSVQLFHLERLSQSLVAADRWKEEVTYFNCWQHHNKWDAQINAMKVEFANRAIDTHTAADWQTGITAESGTYG